MKHLRLATLCLLLTLPGLAASAADRGKDEMFSIRAGVGLTADPTTFLLGVSVPFAISESVALGPALQFGVDDHTTFLAPTWSGEYRIHIEDLDLVPYVHAGAGIAYIEKERRGPGDDDDLGFLLAFGIGADFWVSDQLSVGSRATFNIMPDEVENESFIFSLQLLTGRFSF